MLKCDVCNIHFVVIIDGSGTVRYRTMQISFKKVTKKSTNSHGGTVPTHVRT